MLLSTEKRFIFIHIPKTAGSSVRLLLAPYCVSPAFSQWRRFLSHIPVRENPHKAYLRVHATAHWLKRKLPESVFENYFKFAVVRNPYDYAVSYYLHSKKITGIGRRSYAAKKDFLGFLEYLESKNRLQSVSQCSWICDAQENFLVDELLRFESLETDIAALCRTLNIPAPKPMPHVNTTERTHYSDYYGPREREIADRLFASDLRLLNYSF